MISLMGSAFRAGMLAAFLVLMTVAFAACDDGDTPTGTESNEGNPATVEVRTAVASSGGVNGGGVPRGTVCDDTPAATASATASTTAAATRTPAATPTPCASPSAANGGSATASPRVP
ncbi:MAG: hypothetical protein IT302_15065 [Dehalococcoidia bacterium]|nr:hypothetical protein [Dehalococcoidia bacterium]